MEPDKPSAPKKSRKARHGPPTATAMDVQIWKDFPEDLTEAVVARLPVATFFRFRLVCHKWNSLIKSPSFAQLSKEVGLPTRPWFFAISCRNEMAVRAHSSAEKMTGALYNPCSKKWHHDFPFPSISAFLPACAAGGLVCFPDSRLNSFHVGNPLTQTWNKLPFSAAALSSFRVQGFVSVGMVIPSQGGYKVVWVDKRGQYEVYDSLKKSTCPGRVPANIKLPYALVSASGGVSIGTVVYFLCLKPDGIISYDVVSGTWEQLLIPSPPNRDALALAVCGGRLLLVGSVKSNDSAAISVCVWEPHKHNTMLAWAEVDKMPNSLCSGFKAEKTWFKCWGNHSLLVFSLRTPRKNRIFKYDVVTREWSEAPQFVPPGDTRRRKVSNGIGFFPCVTASP